MSTLIVISGSDSFAALWPELAAAMGARLQVVASREGIGRAGDVSAVVLSVAGAEEEAEQWLGAAAAAGHTGVAVVGVSTDHRFALGVLRAGAADYFALPGDLAALRGWLMESAERQRERSAARRLLSAEQEEFDFSRIVGASPVLRQALDLAARIIPRDRATVLVTGETGTGKELLAQAIHYNGPRAGAPLVELNCAAIPATLLESELFGHEKGAFTDARTAKPGLFEAAHRGTLFLDEIGHLPFELQGKILKALEEKRVRRLGSLQSAEIDVRIIAATHVDLASAVEQGQFREDLYYRLSVIPIHLPPLRDRGEDVVLLAEHFLHSLANEYDLPVPELTPELREALLAHRWPGNVRELRNGMERALLLGRGGLDPAHVFPGGLQPVSGRGGPLPFPATMDEIERAAARAMTEHLAGNKRAAAEALQISRSRLYRLLDGNV